MKTIGLIGGLSWYSTASYYRVINEETQRRLGGHSSAPIALQSLDFAVIRRLQDAGDWAGAGELLARAAQRCQAGGAEMVLICSNLMHRVAPAVQDAIDVPLLHIGDAITGRARAEGWTTLGVLGARWVMEEDFYLGRLREAGVEVCVPDQAGREMVDRVIFAELTQGRLEDASRTAYRGVIDGLCQAGADAVVMACTEIELLMAGTPTPVPLLDSMRTHALAAVDAALV